MKQVKRILVRVLPWLIVATVGFLFYRTLSSNWHKLEGVNLSIDGWSIGGMILFTAAVVVSGVLWGRLLTKLSGKTVSTTDAIRIHSASWLLKYIPGQVGSYLNKVAWGSKNGISKKTISTSFIYENVLMVIAGIVLAIPAFLLFKDVLGQNVGLFLPVLMVIPMAIILSKRLFYRLLNTAFRFLKKKPFKESDFLSTKDLVGYQVGYFVPRLLNGIGFVMIAHSILTIHPSMYVGLAATYILASIVGLLAVFVPGGLGVREAVIVVFVGMYFPVEQAILVALVARLYATVSDIGVALVYLVLNKGKISQR